MGQISHSVKSLINEEEGTDGLIFRVERLINAFLSIEAIYENIFDLYEIRTNLQNLLDKLKNLNSKFQNET